MTVGTKIKQTIASAEGVAANLKHFALDTDNHNGKAPIKSAGTKHGNDHPRIKKPRTANYAGRAPISSAIK